MSTITIIIQDHPYQSNNKAWDALRFAGAALTEDMNVQIHLLDKGVEVGRKEHDLPEGAANLEKLLGELIKCGLKVQACGKALDQYSLNEDCIINGVERGSMKAMASWVKSSDQVIAF